MTISILSTLIKGLSEASKSELADTTDLIIEGDVTKRTRLATLADWIRGKLGIGTASSLTTTSKEVVGAINELNTKNVTVHGILIESTNQTFDMPATYQDPPYLVAAQIQLTDGVWSDLRTLNDIVRIDNNQNQIALIKQNAAAYVNYQVRFLLYVK